LTGKQGHRVRQSSPTARPPSTEEENSVLVPRQYKIVPMPSCSKSIAERTDRLEQHKDKLKVLPIKQIYK
jgi:hypothetical protein